MADAKNVGENAETAVSKNFIEREIDRDLAEGVYTKVCQPEGFTQVRDELFDAIKLVYSAFIPTKPKN